MHNDSMATRSVAVRIAILLGLVLLVVGPTADAADDIPGWELCYVDAADFTVHVTPCGPQPIFAPTNYGQSPLDLRSQPLPSGRPGSAVIRPRSPPGPRQSCALNLLRAERQVLRSARLSEHGAAS